MNNKGKSVVVSEGVRLYQQKNSKYWWLSVRAEGQESRISTKVLVADDPSGKGTARDKAIDFAAEAKVKIKYGINAAPSPTFSSIADSTVDYLDSLTPQKDVYKAYKRVIEKYLKPYFSRKPIKKVNRHAIHMFYEWREQQTQSEISTTQKNVTNKTLDHIFNYACNNGFIEQYEIPQLPQVKTKAAKRREFFSEDQLTQIFERYRGFQEASRNKKTAEIRQNLECYISFLFGTGARPGEEVLNLHWGDISLKKHNSKTHWVARIKKGKNVGRKGERLIVVSQRAIGALEHLLTHKPKYTGLKLHEVVKKYPKEIVFGVSYRDTTPEYGRPFGHYMEYLELDGKGFTLYSLRHTYITHRLLAGDIPRRAIAKQCGTSEEMIEEYYDHVISLDYAPQLKAEDQFKEVGQLTLDDLLDED